MITWRVTWRVTDRWTYGDYLACYLACQLTGGPTVITCRVTWRVGDRWTYGDVWCQVSGVTHGMSITVSVWSISMIGLHRFDL